MQVLDRAPSGGVLRAAAAIALTALLALSACGGGRPARSPRPRVRTFIDVVAALPASLDPAAPSSPALEALETSVAGTLVRPLAAAPGAQTLAAPDRVTGYLARSWRELPGGDLVFRLRTDAFSPYGHALSGADVRFSFARELALSAAARTLARLARIVLADPITVLSPDSVRLNVTGPSPLTLALLGSYRFGVLDSRAVRAHATAADPEARAWLARSLAFYGAYELAQFDPSVRMLLVANPRYWAPLTFDHVAVEASPSATLRLADVGTQSASHTSGLDWRTFAEATRTNRVSAQLLPSTVVEELVPNERVAPLERAEVRRALSLAIDREAIAQRAFGGFARPALAVAPATTPLPADVRAPTLTSDAARARTLLAAAGHPHGFAMTVAASTAQGDPVGVELSMVAAQLRAVGITVATRLVASTADLARLERSGAVGAVIERSAPMFASLAFEIADCCLRGSPGNLGAYESPTLERIAATVARSGSASAAAARLALTILTATLPEIPLVAIPSQSVSLATIGGYGGYAVQATYYDQLRGSAP